MKNKQWAITLAGFTGLVLLLTSFLLTFVFEALGPKAISNLWLNCLGSIGVAIHSHHQRAYPAAALNYVWFGFSILKIAGAL